MSESPICSKLLDGIEEVAEQFKHENIPFDITQANELYDWIIDLDESDELVEMYPEVRRRIEEVFTQE